ncbi:MAG: hypothetical protein AAF936_08525 [Pseudomonadota bacterium]
MSPPNGISSNQTYTEVNADLRDQFSKEGSKAGVRFTDAKGIYVKNSRNDLSRGGAAQLNRRLGKFSAAVDKLKEAINREYEDWNVNGAKMGDYVFAHLLKDRADARLNENDLNKIDKLIDDGIIDASTKSCDLERMTMVADRRDLFRAFREDPKDAAAIERAKGWRKLVDGNHKLREAITADLREAGFDGVPEDEARNIVSGLTLSCSGITPETLEAAQTRLAAYGAGCENLQKLGDLAELESNLSVNADLLDQLNAAVERGLKANSFHDDRGMIQNAVDGSRTLLRAAKRIDIEGKLGDADIREALVDNAKTNLQQIADAGRHLQTGDGASAHANAQMALLLEKHAGVTYDLLRAMLTPEQRDDSSVVDRLWPSGAGGKAALKSAVIDRSLQTGSTTPRILFSNMRKGGGAAERLGSLIRGYDEKLHTLGDKLKEFVRNPSADRLTTLWHVVDAALKLNARLKGVFASHDRLGRRDGGVLSPQQSKLLSSQRTALHRLSAAAAQTRSEEVQPKPARANDPPENADFEQKAPRPRSTLADIAAVMEDEEVVAYEEDADLAIGVSDSNRLNAYTNESAVCAIEIRAFNNSIRKVLIENKMNDGVDGLRTAIDASDTALEIAADFDQQQTTDLRRTTIDSLKTSRDSLAAWRLALDDLELGGALKNLKDLLNEQEAATERLVEILEKLALLRGDTGAAENAIPDEDADNEDMDVATGMEDDFNTYQNTPRGNSA